MVFEDHDLLHDRLVVVGPFHASPVLGHVPADREVLPVGHRVDVRAAVHLASESADQFDGNQMDWRVLAEFADVVLGRRRPELVVLDPLDSLFPVVDEQDDLRFGGPAELRPPQCPADASKKLTNAGWLCWNARHAVGKELITTSSVVLTDWTGKCSPPIPEIKRMLRRGFGSRTDPALPAKLSKACSNKWCVWASQSTLAPSLKGCAHAKCTAVNVFPPPVGRTRIPPRPASFRAEYQSRNLVKAEFWWGAESRRR